MAAAEKLTTKVSTKGQVILPKSVREHRRWRAGTKLLVEDTKEGVLLRRAPLFAPTTVDQVFGALAWKGKPKSLEDMDEGVMAEARRARD
ncbi:MAG: AbrB/MazE/SpoVT family DNA-binding domain-containing protein [Porphyrobacter sp.]|nr:AbrB/MazE/SpoVT family DNA-binding domain-containing protein [Porphyrobacter sp.]